MEIPTPMSPVTDLVSRQHCAPSKVARGIDPTAATQPSVVAPGQNVLQAPEPERNRGTPEQDVSAAVTRLNDYVQSIQRTLDFSVDEDTGRTVVKVIDTNTKEVIRQIPAEDVLKMLKHLTADGDDGAQDPKGIFVREKA